MRRCTMVVVLSLLMSAGFLLMPVNAEEADDSGYDLDIGAIAVGILNNDMRVLIAPPGYQWNADRYVEEGQRSAAQCKVYSSQYNDRLRAFVKVEAPDVDMNTLKNPTAQQQAYIRSTGFHGKDPVAAELYGKMIDSCDRAKKYYNKAFQLTKIDNYDQQAEIFEAGSGIYETLGMTREAEQTKKNAANARVAASAHNILPLPAWIAVFAIVVGLILIHRKRD